MNLKMLGPVPPIVFAGAILALVFVALQWLGETPLFVLAYVRTGIHEGQYWRFISGHFVHFTLYHAVMNGAGAVLVCWALLFRQSLIFFIFINLVLPLWISVATWIFFPEVEQYRGYSGVIHGLVAVGIVLEWRYNKLIYSVAGCLLLGKIIYEHLPSYDVNYLIGEIGVPVATEAHLLGFIGGVVCGLIMLAMQRQLPFNHRNPAAN